MSEERESPLQGNVPVPMGEAPEQTSLQKQTESVFFAFINIVANGIPLLGSTLSELRSYKMQQAIEGRISDLAEELRSEMQGVKEDSIDQEFLISETFIDLVLNAVDTAARTRDRKKIRLVAQILRGAIIEGGQGDYSPEKYLHLISDLTSLELRVARSLYEEQPRYKWGAGEEEEQPWEVWQKKVCDERGIDEDDLRLVLGRIRSAGLIEEELTGSPDGDGFSIWSQEDSAEIVPYRVSSAFEKMMRFLQPNE